MENLNEDEKHQLTRGNSVAACITRGEKTQINESSSAVAPQREVVPWEPVTVAPEIVQLEPVTRNDLLKVLEASGICNGLTAIFKQLAASDGNGNIAAVKMVTAEVRLPTHLVGTRKFCFFRFQREIAKDARAIFDLSQDCFPNRPDEFISKRMCLRRPSGTIIRGHENNSEVVWIENVEVYESPSGNNIFSALLNSNIAFSAKHWVSTYSHRMHRDKNSEIWVKDNMKVTQKVMVYLRDLCDRMKKIFSQCVHEDPDEERFPFLFDKKGIRILKDVNLEWSTSTIPYQEVIKQTTEEPYNRITLYREHCSKPFPQKISKSILQEVSRDHFCS